ncbi:MAG: DUF3108 domain-containing protein [Gammaproteobacteria bacterium]
MTRSPPVWPYAVAGSLLLHAVLLLALTGGMPSVQDRPDPLPIEARLIRVPPPAAPSASVRPRPVLRPAAPAALPAPALEPEIEAGAIEVAAPQADEPATEAGVDVAPDAVAGARAEPPLPVVAPAEAPPLHALPPRIDMRFEVRYGIARGEQTLVWVSEGETYTVTSVAAATGLAGIFYSGRFVQTSQGRLTPRGLVPELFWDQRGDRRSSARFDAVNGMLTYSPARGAPRRFAFRDGAQDTLSLFFQLALTAPPEATAVHQVFNGRRVRDYAYAVRGETRLDTALGPLRTLHLARMADDDGRFEVWLAVDRHYLPVRVLRTDDKGNEVELSVASISP